MGIGHFFSMFARLRGEHLLDCVQFDIREPGIPPERIAKSNTAPIHEHIPNAGIASTEGRFCSYLIGRPACGRAMKRDDDGFE